MWALGSSSSLSWLWTLSLRLLPTLLTHVVRIATVLRAAATLALTALRLDTALLEYVETIVIRMLNAALNAPSATRSATAQKDSVDLIVTPTNNALSCAQLAMI